MIRLFVSLVLLAAVASAQEEKRLVIGFFDSAGLEMEDDTEDPIHRLVEMPLNYLGMVVRRHDIRLGPPPAAWLPRTRAVATFFLGQTPPPDWLWPWLEKEVPARKLRVLHFGGFGPLACKADGTYDITRLQAWLKGFGLAHDGRYQSATVGLKVRYVDRKLCAYEADARQWAVHQGPANTSDKNRVWTATSLPGDVVKERAPVVTGPWGGIALNPWMVRLGDENLDRRWSIDPFAFLREALGLEGVPAPDPCVLNGRRMFFLHLDGDGFESLSTVQPGEYCAKVMNDEIFKRYKLPYTLSIIVRSLTDDLKVKEPTDKMLLAREILNQPFVEAASHGVLHPLKWNVLPNRNTKPRTITWYPSLKNYTYNQVNEVVDSITFINERLLEGGKRANIMLWTGSTIPPEDAIHACKTVNCWNMNGGDFRWDRLHDSVAFVMPWTRRLGEAIQVYCGQTNENPYPGFFDTMPGAFWHVNQSIERTGKGRILKPANIYIHFYSAENPIRLRTIHKLIRRWAFGEDTALVFGTTYARAVHAATVGGRIHRTAEGWSLRGFGDCRTVRIDGEKRHVDFSRSKGVIGARQMLGSLFLHLDGTDAEVVLAVKPPRRPHVESANHLLRNVELTDDGVTLTAQAHSQRIVTLAGFAPNEPIRIELGDEERTDRTDKNGRITVTLKEPGKTFVAVLRR